MPYVTDEIVFYGPATGPRILKVEYDSSLGERLSWARLNRTYAPGSPVLAPMFRVYAVGPTILDAVKALGRRIGWGTLDFPQSPDLQESNGNWYLQFTADGTSMKAAGYGVPGGYIVDWWK